MSKELEAFRNLMERLSNNVTLKEWELCKSDMQIVENALEALTPPTEREVCEALSEYLKRRVVYDDVLNMFVEVKGGRAKGRIIARLRVNKLNIPHDLPLHLITMIGRFYEKESERE